MNFLKDDQLVRKYLWWFLNCEQQWRVNGGAKGAIPSEPLRGGHCLPPEILALPPLRLCPLLSLFALP